MSAEAAVCKFCASDKGFREVGSIRVERSAYRESKAITRGPDGKLAARWGLVESDDFFDEDGMEVDGYECRACDAFAAKLEELVGSPLAYQVGARVRCPDGAEGIVATVDLERRCLTVEYWHEEFTFGEVTAVDPMIDPLHLALAA